MDRRFGGDAYCNNGDSADEREVPPRDSESGRWRIEDAGQDLDEDLCHRPSTDCAEGQSPGDDENGLAPHEYTVESAPRLAAPTARGLDASTSSHRRCEPIRRQVRPNPPNRRPASDVPAPEGPVIATISPDRTLSETPSEQVFRHRRRGPSGTVGLPPTLERTWRSLPASASTSSCPAERIGDDLPRIDVDGTDHSDHGDNRRAVLPELVALDSNSKGLAVTALGAESSWYVANTAPPPLRSTVDTFPRVKFDGFAAIAGTSTAVTEAIVGATALATTATWMALSLSVNETAPRLRSTQQT